MKTSTKTNEVKPLGKMVYGAPELKTLYQRYAFRGLLIAVVLTFISIGSVITYNSLHAVEDKINDANPIVITFNDIQVNTPPVVEVPPPEAPKAPEQVALKDLGALVPEPVARDKSDALTTKTQDKLNEVNTPVAPEGTDDPGQVTWKDPGKLNEVKVEDNIKKDEPVKPKDEPMQSYQVDKAPVAVNLNSVKSSMKYPEIARTIGTEGTCVVKILVGTSGEILKVASISGPDVFHNEIRENIMELQFTPALQGGTPVKCYVNVPFKFSLGNKKPDNNEK